MAFFLLFAVLGSIGAAGLILLFILLVNRDLLNQLV